MNEQWLEKAISTLEGYTNPIKDRYQEFTFSSMRLLYENNVRIFESFLIKVQIGERIEQIELNKVEVNI